VYTRSLLISALMMAQSSAAEPVVFHTSRFSDATTVDLSLLSNDLSTDAAYDFDVIISLSEWHADGSPAYRDLGRHEARVRCSRPASVFVGGAEYSIQLLTLPPDADDWKRSLWRAVCTLPTS
jgi:hypothetical protein